MAEEPEKAAPQGKESKETKKDSSSKALLELVKNIEAWKDQFGEAGITICAGSPVVRKMHFMLASREARAWIGCCFVANNIARNLKGLVDEAMNLLEMKAVVEGEAHEVFTRVAGHEGAIYINLMDSDGRVVRVTADAVDVISDPPVRFIHSKNAKPLPDPDMSGTLDALDDLLHVETREDRNMLISWMLNAFFPKGPYPILVINGEQGSAKTTTTKIVRSILDPATALTRSLPASERDLMVAAAHSWILCFDNVSDIKEWLSDSLCRVATGAGFGVRQHYANKDEIIFDASRPIIFNGIENSVERLDLLNRCVVINLPPIAPDKRKTDSEMQALIEKSLPRILGALLNLLSAALRNLPNTNPIELPRMADFAKRVLSVETLIGWQPGAFPPYYASMAEGISTDAMEGDVVLQAILKLMNGRAEWKGKASELYEEIRKKAPCDKVKFIPKANKLPLARLAPALRAYDVTLERHRTSEKRMIILTNNAPDYRLEVNEGENISLNEILKNTIL